MWNSGNRGEPVAYVDGVPIYADGSRGRKGDVPPQHATLADDGWHEGHENWEGTDSRTSAQYSRAQPMDARQPTMGSLVTHDKHKGATTTLVRLLLAAIIIPGVIITGVLGSTLGDVRDAVQDFADLDISKEFGEVATTPTTVTPPRPVVQDRGQYVAYVTAVNDTNALLREGGPQGTTDLLFFTPEAAPTIRARLRERRNQTVRIRWEQRGAQRFITSVG